MCPTRLAGLALCAAVLACQSPTDAPPPAAKLVPRAASTTPAARAPKRKKRHHKAPPTTPAASTAPTREAPNASCPDDMALVSGKFCRSVEQRCLSFVHDEKRGPDKNRCLRFEKSRCTDSSPERRDMRFCMDRFEYPNREGELPMTLVSWDDAQRLCEVAGKRLCTESEFTFACEGEEMLPYAVGYERQPDKCNIDKPYLTPKRHMLPAPLCEANSACRAEMQRIDGRRVIGASKECVSPFGVFDLNGNANEWVSRPWKQSPRRAAIKGGWWGPVRNRCRAMTTAHGETYLGYEVGFRCCANAPGK